MSLRKILISINMIIMALLTYVGINYDNYFFAKSQISGIKPPTMLTYRNLNGHYFKLIILVFVLISMLLLIYIAYKDSQSESIHRSGNTATFERNNNHFSGSRLLQYLLMLLVLLKSLNDAILSFKLTDQTQAVLVAATDWAFLVWWMLVFNLLVINGIELLRDYY